MSVIDTIINGVGAVGGVGVLGLMVRGAYRALSKSHRRAVDVDSDRDVVDMAMKLLEPAEQQIERLSKRLQEEETRAERLSARIKELEDQARTRDEEMSQLRGQITELKTQLLDAQLEAVRLRGLLDSAPPPGP